MLDVNFNYFKELADEWLKKSKQLSGRVQYSESETQFFLYLWTTEWKYRCIVNKADISRVEMGHYIRAGKRINGRVVDMQDTVEMLETLRNINNQLTESNNRERLKELQNAKPK